MDQSNTKNQLVLKKLLNDDWRARCPEERRSDKDNRANNDASYLKNGGWERRRVKERRHPEERRDGWLRIGKWHSISVFDE
jgi:hypothetical protein